MKTNVDISSRDYRSAFDMNSCSCMNLLFGMISDCFEKSMAKCMKELTAYERNSETTKHMRDIFEWNCLHTMFIVLSMILRKVKVEHVITYHSCMTASFMVIMNSNSALSFIWCKIWRMISEWSSNWKRMLVLNNGKINGMDSLVISFWSGWGFEANSRKRIKTRLQENNSEINCNLKQIDRSNLNNETKNVNGTLKYSRTKTITETSNLSKAAIIEKRRCSCQEIRNVRRF